MGQCQRLFESPGYFIDFSSLIAPKKGKKIALSEFLGDGCELLFIYSPPVADLHYQKPWDHGRMRWMHFRALVSGARSPSFIPAYSRLAAPKFDNDSGRDGSFGRRDDSRGLQTLPLSIVPL